MNESIKVKIGTWLPTSGYDPLTSESGFFAYSVNPNLRVAQGIPSGLSEYATVIGIGTAVEYHIMIYIDLFGRIAMWSTYLNKWVINS